MEHIVVKINQAEEFDRAVHGDDAVRSIPSSDDIEVITKNGGMTSGRAVAVICWTCEADGQIRRAQYSIGVRQLKLALRILDAAYDDDGFPRPSPVVRPS